MAQALLNKPTPEENLKKEGILFRGTVIRQLRIEEDDQPIAAIENMGFNHLLELLKL